MLNKLFLVLIFSICSLVLTLNAGTQGKLLGTIVNKNSNELLVGANIYLEGTNLGAASDDEGKFIIINITPGTYNIFVEYVGYTTQKI